MIVSLSVAGIVALVGLVVYLVAVKVEAKEIGRIMFAVGLLAVLVRLDVHLLVR